MFSFDNQKHRIYQEDYNKYLYNSTYINSKFNGEKRETNSDISNLWFFKSKFFSKQAFIVIPSLFNSSGILLFNQKGSFIEYLTSFGDVYLLEWVEYVGDQDLADYAKATADLIGLVKELKKIHLVGHCIGGNIAVFSYFIQNDISSLTLLTTPWDYSHLANSLLFYELSDIKKSIKDMQTIPKIYIQIMFFMLFPKNYANKLNKYFSLKNNKDKEKYLRIEHWLSSGIGLSNILYNQILDDIIAKNILMTEGFYINDKAVALDQITVPTCVISAKNDQIAPISSVKPLQQIKNFHFIQVNGGHIGYLINNDPDFKQSYRKWLSNLR